MSEHGTLTRYIKHSCRCELCRKAWSVYAHKRRQQRLSQPTPDTVQHGTVGTYINYFCRCQPCKDANNAYHRAYRKAKHEQRASATASQTGG